jgi:hypothetical protein
MNIYLLFALVIIGGAFICEIAFLDFTLNELYRWVKRQEAKEAEEERNAK